MINETTTEILDFLKENKDCEVMTDSFYHTIIIKKDTKQDEPFNAIKSYYTSPYGFYVNGEYLYRFNDKTEKTKHFLIK